MIAKMYISNGKGVAEKNIKTHTIVKKIIKHQMTGMVKELGFKFVYRYGKSLASVSLN